MIHMRWLLMFAMTFLLAACSRPAADTASGNASVEVKTTPASRQALDETLSLYGEIVPDAGTVENISFARPVLVSKLFVRAGEPVKRSQLLLEAVTDPNASSAYVQSQAALALARGELGRTQALVDERLATQSQLAAARKTLADAQAAVTAQRELGATPGTQQIRASREGVVSSLSVHQGDRVASGTTVLQISGSGANHALLGAQPEDIARLAPGMAVMLFPVFGGNPVPAKITQLFGVINPQTRLVDVAVQIDPAAPTLLAALKVRGEVALRSPEVFVLPRSAVLEDTNGAYVFQVTGGHAKRVPVQVRVETGNQIGVDGHINPKLPVVASGNYELEDGLPVRLAKATP